MLRESFCLSILDMRIGAVAFPNGRFFVILRDPSWRGHCGEPDRPDGCSPTAADAESTRPRQSQGLRSQYRRKTRHRLDKMSRDLQVVGLDSTLFLRRIQGYSKLWWTVQSQAELRSNYLERGSDPIGRSGPE